MSLVQGTEGGMAVLATSASPSPDQHHCVGATHSRHLPLRHSIFTGVITAFQANILLNVTRKLLIPYGKALCIFAGQQIVARCQTALAELYH